MNFTLDTALNPWIVSLGMALVSFVWQGAVVGLLCAVALKTLRHAAPQIRYGVAGASLALCLLLPILTLVHHAGHSSAIDLTASATNAANVGQITNASLFALWTWSQIHVAQLVTIWAFCVLIFSLRLFLGLIWIRRISSPEHSSSDPYWQSQLLTLAQSAGIKQSIVLRVVDHLTSPAVAGWIQPVVLMPAALISGMPPELLRALLAHELAHIRRMDFIVNLVQSSVEILLFYHPTVWWISGQIRIERELIADRLAAEMTGEPTCLALALRELEQTHYVRQLAVSANGGNLVNRIKQLTVRHTPTPIHFLGIRTVIPALSMLLISLALVANAATPSGAGTDTTVAKAAIDFASCSKPDYPSQSLLNKDEGTVDMSFVVDTTGRVINSTIDHSSGHVALDAAAFEALKKCTFKPATKSGKPVISSARVTYVWQLPE